MGAEVFFGIFLVLLIMAGVVVVVVCWLAGAAAEVYTATQQRRTEARERWGQVRERRNEVVVSARPSGDGREMTS